jgi:hypothetical protein
LFESWQPYFLLGAGIMGMVLAQSAFQAGPLDASLPTLSATDPIVSVLIGAVAFGETVRTGIAPTTVEVISFAAIVIGIFMLAHTDVVKVAQRHYTLEQERVKTDVEVAPDSSPGNGAPGNGSAGEVPASDAPPHPTGAWSVEVPPTGHY